MSLPITIPVGSWPIITANSFTASYNTPTLSKYDWAVAANQNNTILALDEWSVYIIERLAFTCNISEGDFQDNLVKTDLPKLQLKTKATNQQIFLTPQPFVNYFDNLELLKYFYTTQSGDELQGTFTGELNQSAATAGKATIDANVQLNIYRVTSTEWVKRFIDEKLEEGAGLQFRG